MTVLFFFLGLVFGYVSLALGPLGLIESVIVLGLVLWQVRRFPERSGAYLLGLSLLPVIVLTIIVSRVPVCSGTSSSATQCYAPIAIPALAAFAIAGVIGAALLGATLRRMFLNPLPGPPHGPGSPRASERGGKGEGEQAG